MLGIILFPLALHGLPIDCFTIGNGFGLGEGLLVTFLLGMTQAHGFYGSLIEHTDSAATDGIVKVGRSESLALHIEIRDIELEDRAQCVPHHLLL